MKNQKLYLRKYGGPGDVVAERRARRPSDRWARSTMAPSILRKRVEVSRARLEAFRDSHGGDCNVPQTSKEDPRLGTWVRWQKARYRVQADPATSQLSAERVAALRQMGAIDSRCSGGARSRSSEIKFLGQAQLGTYVRNGNYDCVEAAYVRS